MPPFIAAVLLGAGAYAGFTAARRLWERLSDISESLQDAGPHGDPITPAKDLGALELDPTTGVYRPVPPEPGR